MKYQIYLEKNLLLDLTDKNCKNSSKFINLLFNGKKFIQDYKNIALIPVGDIAINNLDSLRNTILDVIKDRKVEIVNDIIKAENFDRQILLIYKGKSKKEDLKNISSQILLNSNKIDGYIFLDNQLI